MSDTTDPSAYSSTLEVFSILSDETRLNILLTLGNATTVEGTSEFPFNEFWRAVDIDDSGRFNYHLDKLRGSLITEGDDGYRLTYPGIVVYKLVKSGSFSSHDPQDPAETGVRCYECGTTLVASYEDQIVRINCPGCAEVTTRLHVPPGCLGEDSGEHLYRAAVQYAIREVTSLNSGICPNCGDHASRDIVSASDRRADADVPTVYSSCQGCGYWMHTGFGLPVALKPPTVSFYHDHGIDLLAGRTSHLLELMLSHEAVITLEPDQEHAAVFNKQLDHERLSIEIDETLDIVGTERTTVD
jgi:hypothetical protein